MMRPTPWLCILTLLSASGFAANAENIRGMVGGQISVGSKQILVGRPDVTVTLNSGYPDHLAQVGGTLTDQGGLYYFYNLKPGRYMLVVSNHYYRVIDVLPRPAAAGSVPTPQDIGPIIIK